jgi:hypothetical protein
MPPLDRSRQERGHFRRGHSTVNGILRRSGRSPNHTEDPWRNFQLIRLHFYSVNASRTRQVSRGSTEHKKIGSVLCILRFPRPLGSRLYKDHGHRRSNREAKESKPVFPLPQQGAYRFKLRKGKKGKMCKVLEVTSYIYL